MSKIDQFLYTNAWEQNFNPHQTQRLNRTVSDHYPLLLVPDALRWGPCPFKFDNRRLSHKLFKGVLESKWSIIFQNGHPGFAIMKKLKHLSTSIKVWNRDVYKQEQNMMEDITRRIAEIDIRKELNQLSDYDVQQRLIFKSDLLKINLN